MKPSLDPLADSGPNPSPVGHWQRGAAGPAAAEPRAKAGEGWVCPGDGGQAARWPWLVTASPHASASPNPCYQFAPTLQLSPPASCSPWCIHKQDQQLRNVLLQLTLGLGIEQADSWSLEEKMLSLLCAPIEGWFYRNVSVAGNLKQNLHCSWCRERNCFCNSPLILSGSGLISCRRGSRSPEPLA